MSETVGEIVTIDEPGIRWKGIASLRPFLMPIESVESHPRNPRRGNLDVIAASLAEFGQTKGIVVQASTGYICAGNHTRRAALEKLGWTHIAGGAADFDDERALAYLMADNRSSDLGDYDVGVQVDVLAELAESGRLAATGYTVDELDDLLAQNLRLADAARAEFEQGRSEDGEQPPRPPRQVGDDVREAVFLFSAEQAGQLDRWIGMLMREWAVEAKSAVVLEAVRRAAEAL